MIAALFITLAFPLRQEPTVPAPIGRASPLPASVSGPLAAPGVVTLELSLERCVRTVLERNVALRLADLANQANATGIEQALGAFDPELYANASGSDRETPTASKFQSPHNQGLSSGAGLRGLYRSGLAYSLDYSLDYNRQSPSNPFFGLNPTISSGLALNLTQPLLRNFGATANEAPIEQARLLVARGNLDLYQRIQETTFRAVEAYWNLVKARRVRDTAAAALTVAEELVGNNQKKLEVGVMTRLDVLTAQAEAARRKEALIRAGNAAGQAEDDLKSLLSPGIDLADWRVAITPTTAAALLQEALPDEEVAVLEAFADRADLRAIEVDLAAARLDLEVAANRSLPQLDLTGSYGYSGLSGKQAGGATKNNLDLWGESVAAIRDRDARQWSFGFAFSRPLGNRAADAAERRAALQLESTYMGWVDRRMAVVLDLRGALRNVADAYAATDAAMQARVLAEQQYQAERIRLDNDHSTTFQVREAQRDLFEAQDRETAAITQYEILVAGLERARGRLAQHYGVAWEPDGRLEGELRD